MTALGTAFEDNSCPKCKIIHTSIICTEVYDLGTRIRKVVFDACPKCNTKLSKHKEFDRKLTTSEIDKLYPNGKTKPQIKQL